MTADAFLFWFLAIATVLGGLTVISVKNPIYAALALAFTMVGVAAVFVTLGAYFVAGVQLIVYAGAVMVLFVMVLMLFDLKHEAEAFSKGLISGAIKIGSAGVLAGLLAGAIFYSSNTGAPTQQVAEAAVDPSKALGYRLFTQHIFAFEALGVLLLIIAVGAVALSRSKGGTHGQR
ncbi:MAG: NADH-quinone oxidoreductase subunit J [Bdellovibrionales bacterium]